MIHKIVKKNLSICRLDAQNINRWSQGKLDRFLHVLTLYSLKGVKSFCTPLSGKNLNNKTLISAKILWLYFLERCRLHKPNDTIIPNAYCEMLKTLQRKLQWGVRLTAQSSCSMKMLSVILHMSPLQRSSAGNCWQHKPMFWIICTQPHLILNDFSLVSSWNNSHKKVWK